MPIYPMFDNIRFSSDGGEEVVEIICSVREIYDLHKTGRLEIHNARPMHQPKVLPSGKVKEYAGTDNRLKQWVDQLIRNKGILGNLTWNFDPDTTEVDLDKKSGQLTLKKGVITTPDSATRHRAIITAVDAQMSTIDMDRKVSVRGWFVPRQQVDDMNDRLTFEQVFNSYNQDGKPVNATVAKFNYQGDALGKLVRALVEKSPHLGLDNIETVYNTVSASSSKLVAYNTLHTAFTDHYQIDLESQEDLDREVDWLVDAWAELVRSLPDVGKIGKSKAQKVRETTVVRSAVVVYGYIGAICKIREANADPSIGLSKLPGEVVLSNDSSDTLLDDAGEIVPRFTAGEQVDYFSHGNPLWQQIGLLVPVQDQTTGLTRPMVRNARQTRQAVTDTLVGRIGL
jgi:hypothetical protein